MSVAVKTIDPCILCQADARPDEEFCSTCRARELAGAVAESLSAHVALESLLPHQPGPSFLPDLEDFRAVLGAAIEWAALQHRIDVVETDRDGRGVHSIDLIARRRKRISSRIERADDRRITCIHVPDELVGQDVLAWFHGGAS